jgi:hypothetical protein
LPEGTEESLRLRVGASLRLRAGASLRLRAGASPRLRAEDALRFEDEDEELPRRSDDRFMGLGMAIHIVSKNGLQSFKDSIDADTSHARMRAEWTASAAMRTAWAAFKIG